MRLFLSAIFLFISIISKSQECSLFINGQNYQYDKTNKNHFLEAKWLKDRMLISISLPSKTNENNIQTFKIVIVGKDVDSYNYIFCDENKKNNCSNSLSVKWYDENEVVQELNTQKIKEPLNGKINIKKMENGIMTANFFVIYNDITIEGIVRDVNVINLKN